MMVNRKIVRFLEIICPRCRTTQIIYGKCSSRIKCRKCNLDLVKLTGGKTKIKAKVSKIIKNDI